MRRLRIEFVKTVVDEFFPAKSRLIYFECIGSGDFSADLCEVGNRNETPTTEPVEPDHFASLGIYQVDRERH